MRPDAKFSWAGVLLFFLGTQWSATTCFAVPYSNHHLSGTEYYQLFDYHDRAQHPRMKQFENLLINHAYQIVAYLHDHPNYENLRDRRETPLKKLALNLVYTGMYILNLNNGVLEGLYEPQLISDLGARYTRAQAYLDLALTLAPEDDRIHSWAIANRLRKELHTEGSVSEETLDQVMALADRNPIFHLFNALTMASDLNFGPQREADLLKLTEKMDSKDSPCWPPIFRTGEAKQCKTTHKTPFAFQGVTTYMADEFLKTAIRMKTSDPVKSKEYAKRALSGYQRMDFFLFKKKTERWGNYDLIQERVAQTKNYLTTGNFDVHYFQTRNFLDIYTCTSCHQGGLAPTALHVDLR